MNLLKLPLDVLVLIFEDIECDWGWKSATLAYRKQFVATCRTLYEIFTPQIYCEFEFDPDSHLDIVFGHERPFLFARSLLQKPRLAEHLHTLSLTRWNHLFDYEVQYQTLFRREKEGTILADRLGKLLLPPNSNVRILDLDYPSSCKFLDRPFSVLESAIIRPIAGIHPGGRMVYPLAGSLNVSFIPRLLLSPRLKYLDVSSVDIEGDVKILEMDTKARSSSVKVLKMSVGNFSDDALLCLLRMPEALVELEFQPTTDGDLSTNSGSDPANLPKISTLGKVLRFQANTLQTVRLTRGNWYWNANLDQIGTLKDLLSLRELKLDASMLLGWNHCRHHQTDEQTVARSPYEVAECLPDNIEILELILDDYHWERNKSGYVLLILQSLYANGARLCKLGHVTMKLGHLPYCDQCDSDHGMQARRMNISYQEIQTVLQVVKVCWFKFVWEPMYNFWDEVDIGLVHELVTGAEGSESIFGMSGFNGTANIDW